MDPEFAVLLRPFLKYAGQQEITAQSRLHDLGLDSMQAIELLFAIEDRYGVTLPDDRLVDTTFETAGGLWEVVSALQAAAGAELA